MGGMWRKLSVGISAGVIGLVCKLLLYSILPGSRDPHSGRPGPSQINIAMVHGCRADAGARGRPDPATAPTRELSCMSRDSCIYGRGAGVRATCGVSRGSRVLFQTKPNQTVPVQ